MRTSPLAVSLMAIRQEQDCSEHTERRYVLYDLDTGRLLSKDVFDTYDEAAEAASIFSDVLVLPLTIESLVA